VKLPLSEKKQKAKLINYHSKKIIIN